MHIISLLMLTALFARILLIHKNTKREFLVLFIFSVFVYVLGTMFEIIATTLDGAKMGILTRSLGGVFMLPLFLIFVQGYVEVRLPKWINYTIFFSALLSVIMVWTSRYHNLFFHYIFMFPEGMSPTIRVWGIRYGPLYSFVFAIHPIICGILTAIVVLIKIKKELYDTNQLRTYILGLFVAITPITAQVFDYLGIHFQGLYNTAIIIPITVGIAHFTLYTYGLRENEENLRAQRWLKSMITNISHDIKTPLTILSLSLEALQNAPPGDPDNVINTQIAYRKSLDLQRLIQNLIEVTRIDSAQNLYKPRWVPINTILSEIQQRYGDHIESTGLYIDISSVGGNAQIHADPEKIWSVFDNIIYNAVRHTSEGGICVSTKKKNDYMQIIVSDTGCGIAQVHLPMIFERFIKVDQGRGGREGDLGIGLYIVKTIMDNFGGKVEIESELGVGTSVILSFVKL